MIIITESFQKRELKAVAEYFSLGDIRAAVIRLASSGIEMSHAGFRHCKILKVRIGSKPVGRIVVFLQVQQHYFVPVVIRLKKDKIFGENLSMENKRAKALIIENISRALADLQQGRYRKIDEEGI